MELFFFLQLRPESYVWLLLGVPVLLIVHGVVFILTWITIILIPVAKVRHFFLMTYWGVCVFVLC